MYTNDQNNGISTPSGNGMRTSAVPTRISRTARNSSTEQPAPAMALPKKEQGDGEEHEIILPRRTEIQDALPLEPMTDLPLQAQIFQDGEVVLDVPQCTAAIKRLVGKTAETIIEIGHHLEMVKGQLEHGQFGPWLKQEFDWSVDLAEKYMNVADLADKNPAFAEYVPKSRSLTALYQLAAPSTPPEAVQEVLTKSANGQDLKYNTVYQIIARYKAAQTSKMSRSDTAEAPSQFNHMPIPTPQDKRATEEQREAKPPVAPPLSVAEKIRTEVLKVHAEMIEDGYSSDDLEIIMGGHTYCISVLNAPRLVPSLSATVDAYAMVVAQTVIYHTESPELRRAIEAG